MAQNPALPTYSAIYAFGDSLSDAGNDSIATGATGTTPVSPPYFAQQYGLVSGNTFSNGPTWAQNLSVALGLGTLSPSLTGGNDFAFGGAETGSTPQNGGNTLITSISLSAQATQFETLVPFPSSNALYTLSIGANDLLDILRTPGLTAQQQANDISAAVANEITFVRRLVSDGAKNLLIFGVPDLGKTPTVLALAGGSPAASVVTAASLFAQQFNAQISSQLTTVAGLNAKVIDAYGLIDSAAANPASYGLVNATSSVWTGNYTSASSGTLSATASPTQDQNLFFDSLHPTETGHQAVTTLAEQQLAGTAALTGQFYTNILQRVAPGADVAYWGNAVANGLTMPQLDYAIASSTEAQTNVVPVVELYTALGRAPDAAGLNYWTQVFEGGASLSALAGGFITSAEGQQIYGATAGGSPTADAAFVTSAYQELLGRPADAAGAAYWTGQLDTGALRPADVLASFVRSSEVQARDGVAATQFLVDAGNGAANYAHNLFSNGTGSGANGVVAGLINT